MTLTPQPRVSGSGDPPISRERGTQQGGSLDRPSQESAAPRRRSSVAGDAILHPIALFAVAALVVNDHCLKAAFPGIVTGKLSDFAGLVFFPLLLLGAWEAALVVAHRWTGPQSRPALVAVVATALAFLFVKTTPMGSEAFATVLGALQWLPAAGMAAVAGQPLGAPTPAAVVVDPGDLAALPALLVPLAIGVRRARRSGTSEPS